MEGVKSEAASILAAFADYVVKEAEPEILRNAVKGNFWRSVGSSMAANALYTVILILLALLLAYTKPDFLSIIGDMASGGR